MLRLNGCVIANGEFELSADITVEPLSKVAVIGPSGAGKSTLLEAIAGFRDLTRGDVFWQDQKISTMHPGERPSAMLFQDGNLFPHMSCRQNVSLGIDANRRLTGAEDKAVEEALARVGLADMQHRKPAALSGGQRSRVALARVLVQRRAVLLLDEPFAALGPALKAEMLDLVAELVKETQTTLLMVSHDPEDAKRICDQTILVAGGTAGAPVATQALFENPPSELLEYLGYNF